MEQSIGKLIKALRIEKRLTLKEVSEKTGLSISFLSQVERSKSSVTLQSLTKIAQALNVSQSYFFPEQNQGKSFLRRGSDNLSNFQQSSFIYQGLSGNIPNPLFEPMLVTIFPNDQKVTPSTHKGQEFVYVLEGTLTVLLDQDEYELMPGDSFHVESSKPHTWFNQTTEPVKLLYVYSNAEGNTQIKTFFNY